jgi:2-dehydropantoate 2-reductase
LTGGTRWLFAEAGHEVTVIARGAHLAAIRKNGLRLILRDGSELLAQRLRADDIRAAGRRTVIWPSRPTRSSRSSTT